MKILIVCSGNGKDIGPFIKEQIDSLLKLNHNVELYQIKGKGFSGYLRNILGYYKILKIFRPDIVHAHYGLSGLFSIFQRKYPVVITYPGSDINVKKNRPLSKIAMRFAKANIFVSNELLRIAAYSKNSTVIPYGTNLDEIYPLNKIEARRLMNFNTTDTICLFSSSKINSVKNFPLAQKAINIVGNIKLVELGKGYTRNEINLLINSADFLLLTSFSEGSPQIIKEAMACNRPIVSTNVGDIEWLLGNTEGCYLTSFNADDVANKIRLAIEFSKSKSNTKGRQRIEELKLDTQTVAKKIVSVYKAVLK
jgi:glycosyltransferase involved in cell wall biosynthesis